MKKLFLLIATLLLLSAALLTGCQSSSINLMDYVTVTFSGLDGQGYASCTLDSVALEKQLLGDKAGQLTQETVEKTAVMAQFETSLTFEPDHQDTLLTATLLLSPLRVTVTWHSNWEYPVWKAQSLSRWRDYRNPLKWMLLTPRFSTQKTVCASHGKELPLTPAFPL